MPSDRVDSDALLAQLRDQPADQVLRARAAHALDQSGRSAEAIELLRAGLINLTAHGGDPLPCLCKRCLEPARTTAAAGGVTFHRDFAASEGRVLYFWLPDELLAERDKVRESVERSLKLRLAELARARRRRRR